MTGTERWVAIVNPRSGGGRGAPFARRLQSTNCRVLVSERPGHVHDLVRSCMDADGIFVVGGDGTLFEVLQACDRSRQRIGLLPAGRGNSLAKDLGLDCDYDAADCIVRGVDRVIDVLDVALRHDDGTVWNGVSASNIAVGYPAAVARDAGRWRRFGGASYAIGTVTAAIEPMRVHLRCDDGPEETIELTGLVVSNSRYVGPFLGFPSSVLSDGVCHTLEMRVGRLRQMVHNLSSLSGLGFYEPVARKDVRSIDLVLDNPALLKIDGELKTGVREMHSRLQPAAVTFRVPAPHA